MTNSRFLMLGGWADREMTIEQRLQSELTIPLPPTNPQCDLNLLSWHNFSKPSASEREFLSNCWGNGGAERRGNGVIQLNRYFS